MNHPLPAVDLTNPLLQPWTGCFGLPPFASIGAEHFAPAFDRALAAHFAEIAAIATQTQPPTFANTAAALDASGRLLTRLQQLFSNLTASHTSPALQAVEREIAPKLAAHHSAVLTNAQLFARIDDLRARRDALGLTAEQSRLLERLHLDFVFAGARLAPPARARIAQIVEEQATLCTRFTQNVLHDEAQGCLWLYDETDLAGLPESLRAAARSAAEQRGQPAAWAITLSRSLVVPFLTFSTRRDLRQQAYAAWKTRGEHAGEHDNRPLARRILALRNEQARLHGYTSFADFALIDRMAGTPAAVRDLLQRVWEPAKAAALRERAALEALAQTDGIRAIEPWDWRFYAEQVRQQRYDLDDAQVKPYFSLDRMLAAAFDCAGRLFGLTFTERPEIETYHPDVRAFEVRRTENGQDRIVGLFLSDNFARPSKRSGAWMSAYRWQSSMPAARCRSSSTTTTSPRLRRASRRCCRSTTCARCSTSSATACTACCRRELTERLSGTRVLRDFVELPSQIFEHWAHEDARAQASMPPSRDRRADARRPARQGARGAALQPGLRRPSNTPRARCSTSPCTSRPTRGVDITAFEQASSRLGLPRDVDLRHRLPHFQHLFSSSAYASAYYVYMWAAVLDTTATAPSRRRAIRSTRRWPHGCIATSTPQAAALIRARRTGPFAAVIRRWRRCWPSADWRSRRSADGRCAARVSQRADLPSLRRRGDRRSRCLRCAGDPHAVEPDVLLGQFPAVRAGTGRG
jgi:peptidyl-dipeptidase Dcp